ncbi:hypothetical protein S100390_v1c03470 [Spiroplasma sp. NBRC 100390]|uniref:hypothetical protein n=1 Tax=unclassified Spiroplasma TaxID=2637901 RepID=UPI0008927F24|nr:MULTISPECIES: hypothetical protein [unclassified Spiroplasma]AOX43690.1 hypothetical protein STU14_v1c03470 [Spiroplasma sp. TU-14]APE13160.1 hypothetical protein S100390_v1c03470 [Spiroplasma sp. NBRC 100390]
MKKLLTLLGISALTTTGVGTIVGCHQYSQLEEDPNIGIAKDAEILNKISQRASNGFLDYIRTKNIIDSTEYQTQFDNLYTMVDKDKQNVPIMLTDLKVEPALSILSTGFMASFNNINNAIINDYSNYYINTTPLAIVPNSLTYHLNFIDVEQLAVISDPTIKNVHAVRLDFNFKFEVHFKTLVSFSEYSMQYIITDNPTVMKKVLAGFISKISKVVVAFFNKEGTFQIDKNNDFKSVYDNFNVNYTSNFTDLDNIIFTKLKKVLTEDVNLKTFSDNIKYNSAIPLLTLLTSAVNDKTNGQVVVRSETASYNWAGENYQVSQITPEHFVKFYRSFINVFNTGGNNLNLATFNINLGKIIVAGLPLSGAVVSDEHPLKVQVEITEEGLTNKLMQFGNLITAFFKHFQIESNKNSGVFYLNQATFDKFLALSQYDYRKVLRILFNDFKASEEAKDLPGLNIFSLGNLSRKNHNLQLNTDKTSFILGRRLIWNFDFHFGTNNAIFYTGWTSWYFELRFEKSKV